ncbi:hypothetical protein [Streptomyces sp. NPDC058953]|uniref:hypothetical protein n=1 Tax=unclassified Streptomyces TaxID=2593676 RepID=UPI0036968839
MSRTFRTRRSTIAAAALVSVLALTATACGDEGKDDTGKGKDDPFAGKTDAQIVEAAIKATKGAQSVTVAGQGPMDPEPGQPKLRTDINLSIHADGRCTGSMGVKGQGSMEIVSTGTAAYIRPDETFLNTQIKDPSMPAGQAEQVVKMMKGKWLTGSKDGDFATFAEICDLEKIMKEDAGDKSVKPTDARRAGETTVNGQKALKFTGPDGTEAYVAAEGEPYLVKIVGKSDGEPYTLNYSNYGKAPLPKVPSPDDVLDTDQMG